MKINIVKKCHVDRPLDVDVAFFKYTFSFMDQETTVHSSIA